VLLLSYQHSYHAGNFADVHKHLTLSFLLSALNKKSKPWSYLETHSGTAVYDLASEHATKTNEFKQGIARLHQQRSSDYFKPYFQVIDQLNEGSEALELYPGSPWFAHHFSNQQQREGDKISLMELHPGEYEKLKSVFRRNKKVGVHHRDGYEGVFAMLPPKPNRGVILIDPSYEVKDEYLQVVSFIEKAYKRWSNGCFAIWYPLLKAGNHKEMIHKLKFSGIRNILKAEFYVKASDDDRMYGSGMIIINPSWQLDEQLRQVSDLLYQDLAHKEADKPTVNWIVPQ